MILLRLTVLYASFVLLRAAPLTFNSRRTRDADIEDYVNERDRFGGYHFRYRTRDGTYREETGRIKDLGTDHEVLEVTGRVSWFAPDGLEYSITYISNEDGFQPMGEHLPKVNSRGSEGSPELPVALSSASLSPNPEIQTRLSESTIISLLGR